MSKNTQIGELINYISVDGSGNVVLSSGQLVATQNYVSTAITNLVNSAPSTLDTLNELATALGNDPNFATTVATSIGTKQPQLNGTGFVKVTGTTISYDNSTYALDSAVVHLAGNESITGVKTFTGAGNTFTQNTNFLNRIYLRSASTTDYTNLSGHTNQLLVGVIGATHILSFPENTNYTYTFPAASGTLAFTSNLSSYLPLAGGTLTGSLVVPSPFTIKDTNPYIQWQNSSGTRLGYIQHATNLVMSADSGNIILNTTSGNFTLTSTGPATFNNTVTGTGFFATTGSNFATASGRVGVGTSTPADKFVVSNSGAEGIEFGFDTGIPYLFGYNRSTSAYKPIAFVGSGNVIITQGTITDNGSKLQVTGAATFGSALVNYSSVWNNEKLGVQISNSAGWSTVPSIMRLTNYISGGVSKITFTDSNIIDGWFGMVPISGGSYFAMGFSGYTEQGFKLYQNGSASINAASIGYANTKLQVNGNSSTDENNTTVFIQHSFGGSNGFGLAISRNASSAAALSLGADSLNNGIVSANNTNLRLGKNTSGTFYEYININTNGNSVFSGNILPVSDAVYTLGSPSFRWNHVYTTDLHLSNEGKQNVVDGTWGDWTLQEGENDIFMLNNRSGEKFKIKLEKI